MFLSTCLLSVACASGTADAHAAGALRLVLDAHAPFATQSEVARRLLSPVQRIEFERALARSGGGLADYTFAPADAAFDVFVPALPAGERPGLLVFVPPVDAFAIPGAWRDALARHRLAMIVPRAAGNRRDMLEQRIPRALEALGLGMRRFAPDPARTFVAGFSGGARTAQMLAFAWPDRFRGVLQFAGSDPFGGTATPPPDATRMALLRTRMRIVHSTGSADAANLAIDARTRRSLAELCIANVSEVAQRRLGHGLPGARGFAEALDALLRPALAAADGAACAARVRARIAAALDAAEADHAASRTAAARERLGALDLRYGGLASPRSEALAARLLEPPPIGGDR